jgi:hypothetical protein
MEFDLIVCVFACDTVEHYRNELTNVIQTWGAKANEYQNVKVLYFLGEAMGNFQGPEFIHLPGVKNDYFSASHKQFGGLKYIKEHYSPKFVICCGTDTYINIPKLLSFVIAFDCEKALYIGGHGNYREIGDKVYYYHSGGPGFVISKTLLEQIYPKLDSIIDEWTEICHENDVKYLVSACDAAVGYYAFTFNALFVTIKNNLFIACNYLGEPCCKGKVEPSEILCCHHMKTNDFEAFTKLLQDNEYYLSVERLASVSEPSIRQRTQ